MRALTRFTFAGLILAAFAVGCDDDDDAPVDAAVVDATPDAEPDATPDAAEPDAAEPDADPDAAELDAVRPDAGPDAAPDAEPDAEPDAALPDAALPDAAPPLPPLPCEGPTVAAYDPLSGETPAVFPDDFYTVPAETPTGLRVDVGEPAWVARVSGRFGQVFEDLETLDGFGTSAPILLRFSGPIQAVDGNSAPILLAELGPEPVYQPFEAQLLDVERDEGEDDHNHRRTLALWPLFPLKPATRYGLVVLSDLLDAEARPICPSPTTWALAHGQAPDARLSAQAADFLALEEALNLPPEAVLLAATFTTQTVTDQSRAIAADLKAREYAWTKPLTCESIALGLRCETAFMASDYRDALGHIEGTTPTRQYEMPVAVWLPAGVDGPRPVLLAGHGLTESTRRGETVAEFSAPESVVVVAIDAPYHGRHPGGVPENYLAQISAFFGLDLAHLGLDGRKLRDNFRQATFEKLELLELLKAHPDLDGDGEPDVDMSAVGYAGLSLGGIMGSELLALSSDIQASVLGMAGGRLMQVVTENGQLEQFLPLVFPPNATDDDVYRVLGALQILVERGDPVNFAPHVLKDRFDDAPPPNLLMVMAMGDDTVSNGSTLTLARAFGVAQLLPMISPVAGLMVAEAPVRGNLSPSLTAVLAQYDTVTNGGGEEVDATHYSVMFGQETVRQFLHFFHTWLVDGVPEVCHPGGVFGEP